MNFHVSIKDTLLAGGVTLWLLIGLSIYSIALMWQRWRFARRATEGAGALLAKLLL